MIVTEDYRTREDGVALKRTYSNKGKYIIQKKTGVEYTEAIDVQPLRYTYSETDEPIVAEEEADNVEEIQQG